MAFADELRAAGHTVHTPDLYEGNTFDSLDDGVAYAEQVGFGEIIRLGSEAADGLPRDMVYAGFSLGALPAQALTQARAGARGALFFHGGVPTAEFDSPWPSGVPLQMHVMEGDEWTEVDVLETLVEEAKEPELFVYPGSGHLFADASLDDYDERAAELLKNRTLTFLARVA